MKRIIEALLAVAVMVAVMVVLSVPVAMAESDPPPTDPSGGCTGGPGCK